MNKKILIYIYYNYLFFITPTFYKKNAVSLIKGKKEYNNELNIHNSIIFPYRNSNYILLNNNTYDNSLIINIIKLNQKLWFNE